MSTSVAARGSTRPSRLAIHGSVGACSEVKTTTKTTMTSKSTSEPGMPAAIGTVARMIGTAPRRPAQLMKAWCRQSVPNQTVLT